MIKDKITLKTIIFDFDGTLALLNIDFVNMRKSIIDLISSYHVNPDGLDNLFALEMIEAGRQLIVGQEPERESFFLDEAYELIRVIEMEGAQKGKLIDGIEDMLEELRARNIKIGVVTRNCLEAVTHLYPKLEFYCGAVITRENTKKVKPNPEQLKIALAALSAEPESSAMVGDHPMDIFVGKDMGTYTIGVLTGYAHEDMLRDAGADIILETATNIKDLI